MYLIEYIENFENLKYPTENSFKKKLFSNRLNNLEEDYYNIKLTLIQLGKYIYKDYNEITYESMLQTVEYVSD